MSIQNKPRRHHYVPRFLLQNLVQSDKKTFFFYDKDDRKIKCGAPKTLANEIDFYSYKHNGNEVCLEESFFGPLDHEAAIVIKQIVDNDLGTFNEKQKETISKFVAAQYLRVPQRRNRYKRITEDIVSAIGPQFPMIFLDCPAGQVTDDTIKEYNLKNFEPLHKKCFSDLMKRELCLVENVSQHPFFLSDAPVYLLNTYEQYELDTIPGDILFPISPKKAICFYSNPEKIKEFKITSEEIKKINVCLLQNAERFVFSNDKDILQELVQYDIIEPPRVCFEGRASEMLKIFYE